MNSLLNTIAPAYKLTANQRAKIFYKYLFKTPNATAQDLYDMGLITFGEAFDTIDVGDEEHQVFKKIAKC